MPTLIRPPKGRGNRKPGIKQASLVRGWDRIICCASGPSFSHNQAVSIYDTFRRAVFGWRVIVVNTSWQLVPNADVLYGGDRAWWEMYIAKVRANFHGECFTVNRWVAHNLGLSFVEESNEPGLSLVHGRIHTGGNSGYAAIGLAYLFGAREILLVGYDFQDSYNLSHWHGDHPPELNQDRPYAGWLARLPALIEGLQQHGVRVINCSIETAIPESVIPRGDLETCLLSCAHPSVPPLRDEQLPLAL